MECANGSFAAIERTYLNRDGLSTFTVFHPVIKKHMDGEFLYFPDKQSRTGLLEFKKENEALREAKLLFEKYLKEKINESIPC
ncbi:hypothetical protein [Bacillus infantis]|uniref:hypothetical protein n=1 Tax=Bacillus infantis TaxID=324767 RepID=UPI003CF68255